MLPWLLIRYLLFEIIGSKQVPIITDYAGNKMSECDHSELCGTPSHSLCPPILYESFHGITLYCEKELRRLRASDYVPYLASILIKAVQDEEGLCNLPIGKTTEGFGKHISYDKFTTFELREIQDEAIAQFNQFPFKNYVSHLASSDMSFLPRIYFIFSSSRCHNKIFILQNIQFPQDPDANVQRITGLKRIGFDWIKNDPWAAQQIEHRFTKCYVWG